MIIDNQRICRKAYSSWCGLALCLSIVLNVSLTAECKAQGAQGEESIVRCRQFTQQTGQLIAAHELMSAKDNAVKALSCLRTAAPQSLPVANALRDLAEVYERLGDRRAAIENYEKSLQLRSQLLGTEHVSCEPTICHLIELYKAEGTRESAIALLKRLLRIRQQALSGDCAEIMNPMAELSRLQIEVGAADGAAKTINCMAALKAEKFGANDIAVGNLKLVAGVSSLNAHDLKRAEEYLKQALRIYASADGTPETGACYYYLGRVFDEGKASDKAADSYRLCLSAHKKFGDSTQFGFQDALLRAGLAYVKTERYAEAAVLLEQVLPQYEQRRGKKAHCLEPMLLALAQCYDHTGQAQKAQELRHRAAHLDPRRSKPATNTR
jgi:tetratricopeptide (TPR) repeat protein